MQLYINFLVFFDNNLLILPLEKFHRSKKI
jgi:hypothetical protein